MTTIAQQRQRWNAVPGRPPIRLRSQWGAKRSYTDARTVTEPATRQFCHITVTNPANYRGNDAHAQAVERIGISRFPATGISYNWLVMPDGSLYEAQPVGRRGAHTVNDFKRSTCLTTGCPGRGSSMTAPSWNLNFNARAIAFCGVESTPVSDAVVETFARTIYTAYKAGFITKAAAQNIHGHRCVSSKSCPGNRMWARMKDIQARVNKLIAGAPPLPPEEDDMFTDADREMLKRLASVIASHSDEKIDRPDAEGTAGMRFALEQSWHDTHELTEKVPWESPSVHDYARDVLEWVESDDPTKARPQATRYLTELIFMNSDRIWRTVSDPKKLAESLAPLLPSGSAPTQEQLEAALANVLGRLDDPV